MLYLHVGDPSTATEFDGVPKGRQGARGRYAADGSLVGITLLSPRWLLEHDGEIVLTLPERTIRATDLGPVLAGPACQTISAPKAGPGSPGACGSA